MARTPQGGRAANCASRFRPGRRGRGQPRTMGRDRRRCGAARRRGEPGRSGHDNQHRRRGRRIRAWAERRPDHRGGHERDDPACHDCRAGGAAQAARGLSLSLLRRCWRPDVVRAQTDRPVPAHGRLRRPYSQRRETGRPAGAGAYQVRTDSQRWSSKRHRLLYRKRSVGSCDDPSELRCRSVCAVRDQVQQLQNQCTSAFRKRGCKINYMRWRRPPCCCIPCNACNIISSPLRATRLAYDAFASAARAP